MTCFPGWTWEYIDDYMTIPRLQAINDYQQSWPPVHKMIANYLSYGKQSKTSPAGTDENGQSLFDLFPMRG